MEGVRDTHSVLHELCVCVCFAVSRLDETMTWALWHHHHCNMMAFIVYYVARDFVWEAFRK